VKEGSSHVNERIHDMPQRVQLKRRAGWRMPPNTVRVDRATRWGNPLRVRPGYTAIDAIADYRRWLMGSLSPLPRWVPMEPPTLEDIRLHLKDKNLACWCAPGQPCHADVLLELANRD
jgi:Domain of unknown function (DUF4326)